MWSNPQARRGFLLPRPRKRCEEALVKSESWIARDQDRTSVNAKEQEMNILIIVAASFIGLITFAVLLFSLLPSPMVNRLISRFKSGR
jgi:hypothetical protein